MACGDACCGSHLECEEQLDAVLAVKLRQHPARTCPRARMLGRHKGHARALKANHCVAGDDWLPCAFCSTGVHELLNRLRAGLRRLVRLVVLVFGITGIIILGTEHSLQGRKTVPLQD